MTTLDRVVEEERLTSLRLEKVDVEGAESNVLVGAAAVVGRFRSIFVMELHNPEPDQKVAEIFIQAGYTIRRLDGSLIRNPKAGWPDKDGVWGITLATPK
jgi:hypothetical protein